MKTLFLAWLFLTLFLYVSFNLFLASDKKIHID